MTPGIGVGPRGVDVGEHDDVGVDERVGVVGPDLGDPVVPVRLEHRDDALPAVAARPRGGEHRGDLGRQMAVVVDERGARVDAADVEPAGDPAEPGECVGDVVRLDADRHRHRGRARGVHHVVHAAQRQLDVDE